MLSSFREEGCSSSSWAATYEVTVLNPPSTVVAIQREITERWQVGMALAGCGKEERRFVKVQEGRVRADGCELHAFTSLRLVAARR